MLYQELQSPCRVKAACYKPVPRNATAWLSVFLITLFLLPDSALIAQPLPEKLPWSLRSHYTFRTATGSILYCEEDAAWTLNDKTGAPVVEEVSFSIVLGDGRVLTPEHFERADARREQFAHEHSAGTNYIVTFPPHEGLQVRHGFTSFRDRGFQLITFSIENVSEETIPVRKLSPVVFLPNAMHLRDTEAELHQQNMYIRGGSPVFDLNRKALLSLFEDAEREVMLALGCLPQGIASSNIDFNAHGGAWSGEVASHFDPAYPLRPGETLVADAVWLSFGELNRENIDLNYAWFYSTLGAATVSDKAPQAWVTIPDSEDADALLRLAEAWQAFGVRHALIPGNWERIPGALEGAAPLYPRNMSQAARSFRDKGLTPGITVEPMATQARDATATARSEDGQVWLNLRQPEARDHYSERIQTILDWGFDFIVIESTQAPDDILQEFGMTRNHADHLAFTLARAIAGDKVVLPEASMTIQPAMVDWYNLNRIVQRMTDYNIVPGPVRLQAASFENLTEPVLEAMRDWPGPVEILGQPDRQRRDAYNAFFAVR